MPPKKRGRPRKIRKPTLKEKLLIMVGSDEMDDDDCMIKEESLSNDDSGNFTNGGDTDDQIEIFIPKEKSKVSTNLKLRKT